MAKMAPRPVPEMFAIFAIFAKFAIFPLPRTPSDVARRQTRS
jgi:hypothetical protein